MCIIVFVKNITLCKNVLHQTYLWLKSLQLSGFGASRFTVYIETTRIFVHCYRDNRCLLLLACSSWRASNSYFAGSPAKLSMRTSCDKNVIAATWPAGRRQNRKQIQPEFFQLSDTDLFKGEISALLTCTCMRVGKSGSLNVVEISSQIATGCSCF